MKILVGKISVGKKKRTIGQGTVVLNIREAGGRTAREREDAEKNAKRVGAFRE